MKPGWAALYPLQRQWEGQHEALLQYGKDNKNCDQLAVERPGWALTKDCYQRGGWPGQRPHPKFRKEREI
jgi:hypothetical protein